MTKFSQLQKKDKNFRLVNIIFMALIFFACIGCSIFYGLTGDTNNRLFSSIALAVACILPFLIEIIFKFRFYNILFFLYLFYLLVAGFVGSVLNVYHTCDWYDIVIHCLAGYVFALVGILLLSLLDDYKKFNIWTIIVFCFCFTLATELVWELIEWTSDNLFGQFSQGVSPDGFNAPLVTDTMLDILCNFAGGIVFVVHYLIGKFSKKSLGINFIENELIYKRKLNTSNQITETKINLNKNQNDDKKEKSDQ